MSADLLEAIKHVRKNVDMADVNDTRKEMFESRNPLHIVNPTLSDEIYDLMEEYGDDNNLPEGWWLSECDEEDVFNEL